jgi:hypothetical protein
MRQHVLALFLATVATPAAAQLVLPGAVPATPAGTKERPPEAFGKPAKPKGAAIRAAPSEDSVAGKTLWLNGAGGEISLARQDKTLVATELKLGGELISKPGEECRVEVKPTSPMLAKPQGTTAGLAHYQLDLPTCPINFEILDGAILAPKGTAACTFQAADCKVNPAGMWGPQATSIGPEQVKELERSRSGAQTAMEENFHALLARTTDKAAIKKIAAEQAGFSSEREETCRSYALEDVHGFCAARFTEARVIALQSLLGEAAPPPPPKKHARPPKTARNAAADAPQKPAADDAAN